MGALASWLADAGGKVLSVGVVLDMAGWSAAASGVGCAVGALDSACA